jgi:uncharacterized protein (DUF433 family)
MPTEPGVNRAEPRKQAISFRFTPQTVEGLRRRSHQSGLGQGALAERYIEEGVRMDEHPGVYFRDVGSGRRPSVMGTRLDVAQIIETLRQNDSSVEETAEYLEIAAAQVETALRYYAAHREEIDAWIERSRAVAQQERELWQRREQALAG